MRRLYPLLFVALTTLMTACGDVDSGRNATISVNDLAVTTNLTASSDRTIAALPSQYSGKIIWQVEGNEISSRMGYQVKKCNVNGDAYDDIFVSQPQYGNTDEGRILGYYGGFSGFSTTPDWTFASGISTAAMGYFACMGDINADTYEDLIVESSVLSTGDMWAFYGHNTGLAPGHSWHRDETDMGFKPGPWFAEHCDVNGDGYDDLVSAQTENGGNGIVYSFFGSAAGLSSAIDWSYTPSLSSSSFGLPSCGDFDHDGYDDVVVGATHWTNGGAHHWEGAAFIFFGNDPTPESSPSWFVESNVAERRFGASPRGLGDVNGDGIDDFAVGASGYSNGENAEGRIYVYYGVQDVGPNQTPDWTYEPDYADAAFSSTSFAGDLNNDGYNDMLALGSDTTSRRVTELFLGSPSGLEETYAWYTRGEEDGIGMTGSVGINDVDGDGNGDILIGQYTYSNDQNLEGRAVIYSPFPYNEICDLAQNIPSLPTTLSGFTDTAIHHYTPSCAANDGRDVVYKFQGTFNTTYTVDLTGDFNTVVAVDYGTCGSVTPIDCNDNFGSLSHSQITFIAPVTGAYYVWVDGWADSAYGDYTLTITQGTLPTTTTTTTSTTTTTHTTTSTSPTTTTTSPGTTTTTNPGTTTTTSPSTTTTSPGTTTTTAPTTSTGGGTTSTDPGTTTTVTSTTSTTSTTGGGDDDTTDDDTTDDDTTDDDTTDDDTDDDDVTDDDSDCVSCETTGECTAALGSGWVCVGGCCQEADDADDDTTDQDDDGGSGDDDDDSGGCCG